MALARLLGVLEGLEVVMGFFVAPAALVMVLVYCFVADFEAHKLGG